MENFILKNENMVNTKLELVSNLVDINTAINLQKNNKNKSSKIGGNLLPNPTDQNYFNLKCKIKSLAP